MKRKWRIILTLLVLPALLSGCLGALREPGAEQIMADLIGKNMATGGGWFEVQQWQFAALSEFQELNIKTRQRQGQVIEYGVSMRLLDIQTKRQYLADAAIVYKKVNGKWELVSIVTKLWKEFGKTY